ncbi:MAG: hypothetical protein RBR40_00160 [Tenuifilaceae bacterium]|nr:hypothetical protein [Tenuifilaceae bacterium]
MNQKINQTEITLRGEQAVALKELLTCCNSKDYDNKLHLIGIDASLSEAKPPAEAIGDFFTFKKMFVDFIRSIEEGNEKV